MSPTSRVRADQIRELDARILGQPQVEIPTHHTLHAGLYARSILLPKGCVMTSVLIKIPTVVIISGDVTVSTNNEPMRVTGHKVIAASAYRRLAYLAHQDTHITMLFASEAETVEQAEREFTDETESLASRRHPLTDTVAITRKQT